MNIHSWLAFFQENNQKNSQLIKMITFNLTDTSFLEMIKMFF